MNNSLFFIERDEAELASMLVESCGEITDEIQQKMDALEQSPNTACVRYCNTIEELQMRHKAIKEKVDQLREVAKKYDAAIAKVKQQIIEVMEHVGQKKLGNDLVTATLVVAKDNSLVVDDAKVIPDSYHTHTVVLTDKAYKQLDFLGVETTKHTRTLDKNRLKKDLKANKDIGVVGAHLDDSKSIRIKY